MTYSRIQRPADRVATLVAVGALQAAAFYALIAGFTVAFTPADNPPPITATNSPLPPPPAPDTPERTRPAEHETITTITPLNPPPPTVAPNPGIIVDPPLPPGTGDPVAPKAIPEVRPTVSPAVALRPRPLGRPGEWVTDADYPTNAIRLGHAGTVGFTLTVSAAGRVTGCEVTRSSGFADLDGATCALLVRRGRFQPATDAEGKAASGTYANAVRWQLPD